MGNHTHQNIREEQNGYLVKLQKSNVSVKEKTVLLQENQSK